MSQKSLLCLEFFFLAGSPNPAWASASGEWWGDCLLTLQNLLPMWLPPWNSYQASGQSLTFYSVLPHSFCFYLSYHIYHSNYFRHMTFFQTKLWEPPGQGLQLIHLCLPCQYWDADVYGECLWSESLGLEKIVYRHKIWPRVLIFNEVPLECLKNLESLRPIREDPSAGGCS